MFIADQELRKFQFVKKYPALLKSASQDELRKEVKKMSRNLSGLDKKHSIVLKKIIKQYGWPGRKLVGKRGASYSWLLAQHAVHDLKFQKDCLQLMKKALKQNNVELKHIALLTDRILMIENKRQIYGTQFQGSANGKFKLYKTINIRKLDERRKAMGLELFKAYKKKMEAYNAS